VVIAIAQWGDEHLQNGRAPLTFVESGTGRPIRAYATADTGVTETQSSDIEIRARFTLD
jgi:hypothetical protein